MATPRSRAAASPAAPLSPAAAGYARAFRQQGQDGELYRLPGSGLVARLRRPSLIELAARGTTPNPLSQRVLALIAAPKDPSTRTEAQRIEDFQANASAFVEIAALAFVEPRLVVGRAPDYDAGEIAPADVCDRDLVWIYYDLVEGAADEVATFRLDP